LTRTPKVKFMIVFYQEMLGEKVKGFAGIIKLLREFLGMFDFSDFNEEALKSLKKSISVVIIKSHRSKNYLQKMSNTSDANLL